MYAIRYRSHSTVNGKPVGVVYAVDISHLSGRDAFSYCASATEATHYETEDDAWRVIQGKSWDRAQPVKILEG